ncbi:MAG TPA: hypothetical protein VFK02_18765 [Kofleriaceae bacterium]|nr:hypothetical protein [Kofleriaceae bacterium]
MTSPHYEPITDWSREGRTRLVEQRGAEIRALLEIAFVKFYDHRDLEPFGFRGEDPLGEAVEWSVERFASGELDPRHCTPTFRIFTEVQFWLAQKVGKRAYKRIMWTRAEVPFTDPPDVPREPGELVRAEGILDEIHERLARSLQQLAARTCADLVGYWLSGTLRQRSAWFGWAATTAIENTSASKKQRSFHMHDALFRFQCLHQELVPDADGSALIAVVRESMFRPCENRPPYRRPDEEVAPLLPAAHITGPRSVGKLRRAGLATLLTQLLALVEQIANNEHGTLERVFLRTSLSATTAHALDLERRDDLLRRLKALPPAESLVSEEL